MPIWLMGERAGNTASDNIYDLFCYCRDVVGTTNVYFVAKRTVLNEIENHAFILEYGSIRHLALCCIAKIFVYDVSYQDCIPRRALKWSLTSVGRATKVFISHGVDGLKKATAYYRDVVTNPAACRPDLWLSSTYYDLELKKKRFLAQGGSCQLTGMPRMDKYHERSKSIKVDERLWVFCLTYRSFESQTDLAGAGYTPVTDRIQSLLTNELLQSFLDHRDVRIKVLLHHEHENCLAGLPGTFGRISVIKMSDMMPDDIVRAGLLITDYSSLAFTMMALHKPTVFYWPDHDEVEKLGGGTDLGTDEVRAIGPVTENLTELLETLDGFLAAPERFRLNSVEQADLYFPYLDTNNCERCYQAIVEYLKTRAQRLNTQCPANSVSF